MRGCGTKKSGLFEGWGGGWGAKARFRAGSKRVPFFLDTAESEKWHLTPVIPVNKRGHWRRKKQISLVIRAFLRANQVKVPFFLGTVFFNTYIRD